MFGLARRLNGEDFFELRLVDDAEVHEYLAGQQTATVPNLPLGFDEREPVAEVTLQQQLT